ncbi:hypothetical protein GX618_01705 [Candidatus Dojkabacteria bacterium]|uniref:Uncharacterized protein n=1 Tax=Candidatus Dojkabacteria bacterium TaxID=2099670 RepID=A0A847ETR6_9BACT|nr:hypothetical protein [Candidatus Dojkabacteria bacterium]
MVYQYSATATPNINYNINIGNDKVNTLKPKINKNRFEPALQRARKALQLVNPFKGV